MSAAPPGFDMEAHRRHVEAGGCPYIEGKTWCNGRIDDLHQNHWALHIRPDGTTTSRRFSNWQRIDHSLEKRPTS